MQYVILVGRYMATLYLNRVARSKMATVEGIQSKHLLVDAMRYHFPNVVNLITYAVTLKLAFESDPITVRAFKLPLTDPDTSVLVVLVREDRIS